MNMCLFSRLTNCAQNDVNACGSSEGPTERTRSKGVVRAVNERTATLAATVARRRNPVLCFFR
nr:MAG TPA: hypothetical protein [Caudoviricetes sp.]